jgi:hypothetical protein
MPWWSNLSWDVARAGGLTAYTLLTVAVGLGLALSLRWQSPSRCPRLLNDDLHQRLLLWAAAFVTIHVIAVWVDPFTAFRAAELWVPGLSHYRPLWMALGIVALYLGVALALSAWLRPKIGWNWWRRLHYLTFAVWALATAHGLGTGSDTATGWARALYLSATAAVLSLSTLRLLKPASGRGRPRPGWAAVTVALAALGIYAAWRGPLQPGWNQIANGGHGNGARVAVGQKAPAPVRAPAWSLPTGTAIWTAAVEPNLSNPNQVVLTLPFHAGVDGVVEITLRGSPSREGWTIRQGELAIGPDASHLLYQGPLVLRGRTWWAPLQGPSGPTTVRLRLIATGSGQVAAQLYAVAGASAGEGDDVL